MKMIFNDDLIAREEAKISVDDRGLLLGDGLFETICVYQGHPLFFDRHWDRLVNSLHKIYIPLPMAKETLLAKIKLLIAANAATEGKYALRLTVTRGSGARGINITEDLHPTYFMTLTPYPAPKQNMSLLVSSIYRDAKHFLHQMKSLNYLESVLARQEARLQGFDEGLFLNTDGYVIEAPIANFFIVKDGTIITPPLSDGIMPGVTRAVIIEIANQRGIPLAERSILLAEAQSADAVFLTNALVGIQTVSKINERAIKVGNDIVDQLATYYLKNLQCNTDQ